MIIHEIKTHEKIMDKVYMPGKFFLKYSWEPKQEKKYINFSEAKVGKYYLTKHKNIHKFNYAMLCLGKNHFQWKHCSHDYLGAWRVIEAYYENELLLEVIIGESGFWEYKHK